MPKPVRIEVLTMRMSDMKQTGYRVIDHNNEEDRQWLGKHCYWAFRNGHGVQTAPLPEKES